MTESEERENHIRESLDGEFCEINKNNLDVTNEISLNLLNKIKEHFYNYYFICRKEGELFGCSAIGTFNIHMGAIVRKIDRHFKEQEQKK